MGWGEKVEGRERSDGKGVCLCVCVCEERRACLGESERVRSSDGGTVVS